ncbi:MAG: DUF4359 domain-containing protein [Pseudanabaena sp.]
MKTKALLIGTAIVVGVMAVTNPSKNSYVDYAGDEVTRSGKNYLCTNMQITLQQQCQTAINLLISQGKPLLKQFIDSSTNQQNFGLFSLYTTVFPNRILITIAVFGNFYTFQ